MCASETPESALDEPLLAATKHAAGCKPSHALRCCIWPQKCEGVATFSVVQAGSSASMHVSLVIGPTSQHWKIDDPLLVCMTLRTGSLPPAHQLCSSGVHRNSRPSTVLGLCKTTPLKKKQSTRHMDINACVWHRSVDRRRIS